MEDASFRQSEKIACLQKLCPKPIAPTKNQLHRVDSDRDRCLSFKDELEIVECLTYLVAHSNEPEKVLALCIEERAHRRGLVVSVASNTGLSKYLLQGVRNVVAVLEQQARFPMRSERRNLLQATIAHGRARIVRRLGLKNPESSRKPFETSTATRLKKALTYLLQTRPKMRQRYQRLYDLSTQFNQASQKFGRLAASLQGSLSGQNLLMSIIETVTAIWRSYKEDIIELFGGLPKSHMDNNNKQTLLLRLRHLGQYIPAVERLLKYATRLIVFQSIEVREVYIPPPVFCISQAAAAESSFNHMEDSKDMSLEKRTQQHVLQNRVKGYYKVHAEIQLIFDYEQRQNVTFQPRVIKSSKSACFLCDLFIKIHGGLFTPKTHGRVYELWILPDMLNLQITTQKRQELVSIVERFNAAVEELLFQVQNRTRKQRLPDPRESDVFSLAPSTVQGTVLAHDATEHILHRLEEILDDSSDESESEDTLSSPSKETQIEMHSSNVFDNLAHTPSESHSISASSSVHDAEPRHYQDIHQETVVISKEVVNNDISMSPIPLVSTPTPAIVSLQQGVPVQHVFNSGSDEIRLHSPRIHIRISHYIASKIAESCSSMILKDHDILQIEALWIEQSQVPKIIDGENDCVADLGQSWSFLDLKEGILFGATGLLIKKKSEVVRLKAILSSIK